MNAYKAKINLAVITAFANGSVIQYNDGTTNNPEWVDRENLSFDGDSHRYRIKPEPRIIYRVEVQTNFNDDWVTWATYGTEQQALDGLNRTEQLTKGDGRYKAAKLVKFVEQL